MFVRFANIKLRSCICNNPIGNVLIIFVSKTLNNYFFSYQKFGSYNIYVYICRVINIVYNNLKC